MNRVILIGRIVRDPEVRQVPNGTAVARYTLAVDRKFKKDGEGNADFINCVVFGKGAEFTEKYLFKGTKIAVVGRIQTGSYTNKDGQRVNTTDIIVEEQEFAESKASNSNNAAPQTASNDGFINMDVIDEELPFF